jgi:hypothetical protein
MPGPEMPRLPRFRGRWWPMRMQLPREGSVMGEHNRSNWPLDTLHFDCNCVPELGPTHCHGCSDEAGNPVPWAGRDCGTTTQPPDQAGVTG